MQQLLKLLDIVSLMTEIEEAKNLSGVELCREAKE
jgi:hypothetical protein